MQNFMKTILSGVQTWTKGKIKDSTADWNQNDSNADNYVKNRPFYEENGVVHKLDKKYLDMPDNIATIDDVQSAIDGKMDATNPVGTGSFSIGRFANSTVGEYSATIGANNTASGKYSCAIGKNSYALGEGSCAIGRANATAKYAFAVGSDTQATGNYSVAMGYNTKATSDYSFAVGNLVKASGPHSHAEGNSTTASGSCSHAEGTGTTALGVDSHVQGEGTIASRKLQSVSGSYNLENDDYYGEVTINARVSATSTSKTYYYSTEVIFDYKLGTITLVNPILATPKNMPIGSYFNINNESKTYYYKYSSSYARQLQLTQDYRSVGKYAHIVGNGTSIENRSNAHTLEWDGKAWYAGDVYVGGKKRSEGERLARVSEIPKIPELLKDMRASEGQLFKVKTVDENGKPMNLESFDLFDSDSFTEIIPEGTLPLDSNGEATVTVEVPSLVLGATYIVVFNGAKYSCIAQKMVDGGVEFGVGLGNVGAFIGGTDTGEPFIICRILDEMVAELGFYAAIKVFDGSNSATISISKSGKIRKEYLPDFGGNVAYDEAQNLTEEQKAQARENIGAQPVGDYALSTDVQTFDDRIAALENGTGNNGGAGILLVTVDENNLASHSKSQIWEAARSGVLVFLSSEMGVLPLDFVDDAGNVAFVKNGPDEAQGNLPTWLYLSVNEDRTLSGEFKAYEPSNGNGTGGAASAFVVNVNDNLEADKTNAEIYEAFVNKRTIYAVANMDGIPCVGQPLLVGPNIAMFIVNMGDVVYNARIENDVASVETVNLVTQEELDKALAGMGIPDSGGNVDYVGVEPAEDDIPKVFFGGALQQTKDEAVVPFRYISKTDDFSGYAEIKAQGNSSMNYPKKNQTVKMFADEACDSKLKKDFKGWGKQNKHVYKANWIDLSHARNVVSARLWADVVKSRANYADLPELFRTTPNQGAVDGFPVKVYAAGVYQGRYTLNIPKDKWTFNMDDELDEHCVLCGENYVSGCFRAAAQINESDWTDEIHDTVPASIKTRWNEVISFVMNSTDDEFRANLSRYFYVDSLIDYYLFGLASCGLDAFGKNQIYATYDGQKWIASMYDMDSTWGLYWNGSKFVSTSYGRNEYEDYVHTDGNLLYNRLEQLFWSELQTRWAELKSGALSIENIINRFERFTDIAPAELVKEDYASTTGGGKFTGIPSQTTNNIQQIRSFALARQEWTDTYIAGLTPEVEVPCTGISLSANTLTFSGEGTQTLTATVTPDGCTDTVTWLSDNTGVATVSGGVVTAIANGSATITAKCGEYSASCSVAVSGIAEPVPCTGITLDKTELTFNGEGTQTITATVTPADTTDTVVWVSSNPTVAAITVEGNVCTVQSVGNGSATITVTCGNYSASCSVSVSGIAAALLYSLAEATEFDGVDDYIDTGIQLFDTPKDFTLLIRADFSQCSVANANVFHCIKEASPYPGLSMNVNAHTVYRVGGYTGTGKEFVTGIEPAAITGLAVTANQGIISSVRYLCTDGVVDVSLPTDITYTAFAKNLVLGCYQDDSGTRGRFWNGTIHEFKVWNAVLSDEEIESKLHFLDSGTLYSDYAPAGTSFEKAVVVDWDAGSYIEAEIDLTNCTGTMENVFSIGKNVNAWRGYAFHIHHTANSETIQIGACLGASPEVYVVCESYGISGSTITVRFDKDGLAINGTLLTADDFNGSATFNTLMEILLAQKVVQVGASEGATRSHATYNYIRVGVDV